MCSLLCTDGVVPRHSFVSLTCCHLWRHSGATYTMSKIYHGRFPSSTPGQEFGFSSPWGFLGGWRGGKQCFAHCTGLSILLMACLVLTGTQSVPLHSNSKSKQFGQGGSWAEGGELLQQAGVCLFTSLEEAKQELMMAPGALERLAPVVLGSQELWWWLLCPGDSSLRAREDRGSPTPLVQ